MTKTQNLKRLGRIWKIVRSQETNTQYKKAVRLYALELLGKLREAIKDENVDDAVFQSENIFEKEIHFGASDFIQYSFGGCSLCYNEEIKKRLYTEKEILRYGDKMTSDFLLQRQAACLVEAKNMIWNLNIFENQLELSKSGRNW